MRDDSSSSESIGLHSGTNTTAFIGIPDVYAEFEEKPKKLYWLLMYYTCNITGGCDRLRAFPTTSANVREKSMQPIQPGDVILLPAQEIQV